METCLPSFHSARTQKSEQKGFYSNRGVELTQNPKPDPKLNQFKREVSWQLRHSEETEEVLHAEEGTRGGQRLYCAECNRFIDSIENWGAPERQQALAWLNHCAGY